MKLKNIFRTLAAIVVMFAVCNNVNAQDEASRIREGLRAIPSNLQDILTNKSLFNAPQEDKEQIIIIGSDAYKYVRIPKSVNQTGPLLSDTPDQNIYPGAIVIANADLTLGKPTPLSGVPRGKVQLFADFQTKANQIMQPVAATNGSISIEVNSIIQKLFTGNGGSVSPKYTDVETKMYSSIQEMMLDFKCSASYLGNKVSAAFSQQTKTEKFMLSVNLIQDFYTLRLDNGYKDDVSLLFANGVTWNEIQKAITINGKQQPLALITSVTYGRRVYFLNEKSASEACIKGSEKVTIQGTADLSAKQELSKKTEDTKNKLLTRGGGSLLSIALTNTTKEALEKVVANTYVKDANDLVPVAYEMVVLTGPALGTTLNPTFSGQIYLTESMQKLPNKIPMVIKNDSNHSYWVKLYAAKVWTVANGKATYKSDVLVYSKEFGKEQKNYQNETVTLPSNNQYIEGYEDGRTLKLEIWYGNQKKLENLYIRIDGRNQGKEDTPMPHNCIDLRISKKSESMPYLNPDGNHTVQTRYQ